MKKRSMVTMVLIIGAYLSGQCQFTLKPIALSGVSSIQPFQLPKPVFTVHLQSGRIAGTNDICPGSCTIILPLTSLQLLGSRLNNYQVALDWKTKNETDSRGFDIERSLGDANHFSVVGSTPSATGSAVEKKYAIRDMNNYSKLSFYRVKQIDLDGHFAYSNTIQVQGYTSREKAWLSPDPADANTVLTCYSASEGTGVIQILTAHGQNVYQASWSLYVGNNSLNLSLSKYAAGSYYVQLTWPGGYHSSIKLAIK